MGGSMSDTKFPQSDESLVSLCETKAVVRRAYLSFLIDGARDNCGRAAYVFGSGFLSIAILAGLAMVFQTPLVFPSLGPTAFLLFFCPALAPACPRDTLYGHAIAIVCGYGALWLCGLTQAPAVTVVGVDGPRIVAASLSIAATGACMILADTAHPPAGATTLIISLGILTRPLDLVMIEVAVALLTLMAIAINRLFGINYPVWSRCEVPASSRLSTWEIEEETKRNNTSASPPSGASRA